MVTITIDHQQIAVDEQLTILEAAKRHISKFLIFVISGISMKLAHAVSA